MNVSADGSHIAQPQREFLAANAAGLERLGDLLTRTCARVLRHQIELPRIVGKAVAGEGDQHQVVWLRLAQQLGPGHALQSRVIPGGSRLARQAGKHRAQRRLAGLLRLPIRDELQKTNPVAALACTSSSDWYALYRSTHEWNCPCISIA